MKAKKSYGQHFLNNEAIAEQIANSLRLAEADSKILEVGPGMGMLTKYLIPKLTTTTNPSAQKAGTTKDDSEY